MALEIHGKTALVTGGASGIGLALSHRLLDEGCNVVIADLTLRAEAQELINKKFDGASASFIKTDVTIWSELQAAFDHTLKEFKQLDIVFPGAGIFDPPVSFFTKYLNIIFALMSRASPTSGTSTKAPTPSPPTRSESSTSTSTTLFAPPS